MEVEGGRVDGMGIWPSGDARAHFALRYNLISLIPTVCRADVTYSFLLVGPCTRG